MAPQVKFESASDPKANLDSASPLKRQNATEQRGKEAEKEATATAAPTNKRKCVSTACIACRRRKSKCDGNLPKCAACASVYMTECEYAPHTDHRRKGVYKKDGDSVRTKNATLETLLQALLNYEEDAAHDLLQQIRACDNLEELAQSLDQKDKTLDPEPPDSPVYGNTDTQVPRFEAQLSGKMGDLVIDGSIRFIGGTSNLLWLNDYEMNMAESPSTSISNRLRPDEEAIVGWTTVTDDRDEILHFMNLYFCWHYTYFTTLSKQLFYRDFLTGTISQYCSPLLVNVMLALGCHFSARPTARADPYDSATTGDHFFAEAKRLLHENDEFADPRLCTVQALALMSVREAGCGRESKGWVYSGMSFRMASDLGLNVDVEPSGHSKLSDEEVDARSITFWGCFLFDKCWSNYLGRQPQLLRTDTYVKKPDVFGPEDSEMWAPYTDSGIIDSHTQPARTRAIALQIVKLAEISSDLLTAFYQPQSFEKPVGKQAELKRLTDIHTRLETWKKELPAELEPKDGQLPHVLLMHMFYQLLYIHLYRPFLKYTKATSPLPSHVSPRKFCTQAAGAISKLLRLYKKTHGLHQVCNIAVYIAHSACTIHLLNLPDKNARRDIIHGVKHLEEIGEYWTCARRTLRVLEVCAEKWEIELPEETNTIFMHARQRWEFARSSNATSPVDAVVVNTLRPVELASAVDFATYDMEEPENLQQPLNSSLIPPQQSMLPHQTTAIDLTSTSQGIEGSKSATQLRAMTKLTKAQQEAWNAHQARMTNQVNQSILRQGDRQGNAASLFGGIDSLIQESQDWWLQDQAQLASGFVNWTAPSTDWTPGSHAMGFSTGTNSSTDSPTGSMPFQETSSLPNGYGPLSTPIQPIRGLGMGISPQIAGHLQQPNIKNMNTNGMQTRPGSDAMNPRKRMNGFEDDHVFY